jgi:hypothetical protein
MTKRITFIRVLLIRGECDGEECQAVRCSILCVNVGFEKKGARRISLCVNKAVTAWDFEPGYRNRSSTSLLYRLLPRELAGLVGR